MPCTALTTSPASAARRCSRVTCSGSCSAAVTITRACASLIAALGQGVPRRVVPLGQQPTQPQPAGHDRSRAAGQGRRPRVGARRAESGRDLTSVGLGEQPHRSAAAWDSSTPTEARASVSSSVPTDRDREVEDAPQRRPGSVHSRQDPPVLRGVELLD